MKAYVNARVWTGEQYIEKTTILVNQTEIVEIGEDISVPSDAEVIDLEGKFVTPGLIDVHTHLGVHSEGLGNAGHDFNETSEASTPYIRSLDGLNPQDNGFAEAIKHGVTTVQVLPGSANVIGGEIVAVKTVGTVADQMVIKSPSGMKAALGENPKRIHGSKGKAAVTRMGVAGLLRQELMRAEDYNESLINKTVHTRDLGMEQLAKVIRKEIPLRVHAHRADDIVTIIRIKKEFDIDITIEHCTEGHLLIDFLVENPVPIAVGPTMSAKSKQELANKAWDTMVLFEENNIPFAITTDHPVITIDHLLTTVKTAVNHGLSEETALRAITSQAAIHIGLEDKVGSLKPGLDADLVIWTESPFNLMAKVEQTIIKGETVYSQV
ncbi:amidohydrolase [Alkalicoccobacillus murimartini]|uniref:Imidazolonepropionase-like amidohydrolase n=1 Tax=Alkalicoccobacillus murimartini TaxID=171685 RepID=A0ABT9YK75_9BACI|nr:amidohydrolase [Alkalicoccobacillus murimartini]MDQ0207988.1 imidazolonepropionase-like amidohydrolase [Alkalicoccobacillus murimartini]